MPPPFVWRRMSTPFDNDNFSETDDLFFDEDGKSARGAVNEGAVNKSAVGSENQSARGILGGVASAFSGMASASSSVSGKGQAVNFPDDSASDRNNIITARGTAEGIVLRIDGRVQPSDLLPAVKEFLASRRSFLAGHDVAFEWIGKKAEESLIADLTSILSSEYAISVRSSKLKTPGKTQESSNQGVTSAVNTTLSPLNLAQQSGSTQSGSAQSGSAQPGLSVVGGTGRQSSSISSSVEKTISLFDGMEGFDAKIGCSGNSMLWDEPDARLVYGTLRSGQKIETEHSVVVFGDVNSGAEVIAGGDIVILGTLRGIAHAGAYDESGGGRVIFALNLQPTQLRIGLVISRGASGDMRPTATERGDKGASTAPEIARVDNNMIVVELYQSRTVWVRRRE